MTMKVKAIEKKLKFDKEAALRSGVRPGCDAGSIAL